jgi:magnesium-transporting ATPase (P-type)
MSTDPLYALSPAQVWQALDASPAGLSSEAIAERLALYGANALREPPADPPWRLFLSQTTHPTALLLLGAGALALLGQRPVLGLVIWGVVLVNAAFSFWQEYRAERAVAALKRVLPAFARLMRAGQETKVPASEIVPGDVLVLAEGDNIPADARLVEAYGLRVNQAVLTGEAMPALKVADASLREGLSELERPNLLFTGSSIVAGTGRAVVFATGMVTQFGRIANLTQAVKEEPSPLQRGLARLTRVIALVALGLGLVVFVESRLDVGLSWLESFLFALGLIVAVVPEGLRPTVTLSLAMAVQRLAQRGVLVKKLAALETLGATSVICTDKSGTLTQNQMTVREVWVAGQRLMVSGLGYDPQGGFTPAPAGAAFEADLQQLLEAALLCNNSRLTPPSAERSQWTCLGDQTEAALRVLALKGGADEARLSQTWPRIHELPFDARRKRMATIHRRAGGEVAFVKGAPKEVLALCTRLLTHGEVRPLDAALRAEIMAANDDYARGALRVLALARRDLPRRSAGDERTGALYTPERVEQGLTFLGLAAMMDPPRPEVAAAVKTFREAGIRLVMITGDYGLTAESLARRVGMISGPAPRILIGAEIDTLGDAELQDALSGEVIFARMAPEHKLRLVAAFQARGDVVAVTGDGVNDAPALRKADIGLAMGVTGTDVAKEAADVILTDDNFAAIASAIEEGRAVYDNLRKFITYIFASNVPEVLPFLLAALLNIPLALTVTQILAIDLVTDLLPALALGTERPEPTVMQRPPRRREQPWLDRGLLARAFLWLGPIEAGLCFAGFFAVYALAGYNDWLHLPRVDWLPFAARLATPAGRVYILATTVFHAGVVMAQVGNAFACRSERAHGRQVGWLRNRFLLVGVGAEIILIALLIYVPSLAATFEHQPLPPLYWAGLGLFPFVIYGLDRLRKSVVRRHGASRLGVRRQGVAQ